MNRIHIGLKLALVFTVMALWTASAAAAGFLWPTIVMPGPHPPLYANAVLGRPNGSLADFRPGGTSATYGAFDSYEEFDPVEFADMLGVTVEVLGATDFVAFEAWGTSFELSTWIFSSAGETLTVEAPGGCLATGTLSTESYADYFGIPWDGVSNDVWQFILIDLGTVSGVTEDFEVEIQRGYGPYGSPDIDAIGVLSWRAVASEKSSWSRVKAIYR